jgi:hypothetical protein
MKKQIIALSILLVCSAALFTSCKKEKDAELDSQTEQFNTDANNYKTETDQVDNDINSKLGEIPAFGRGTGIVSSPLCGVTIDSSQIAQKILFFNFDGQTECFSPSRTRSGKIKVELINGTHWSDMGAVLKETYIDFKITRSSDQQFIMFNGVKTVKNINGNNWLGFILGTSILRYQSRAFNIAVTFNNNVSATWNTAHTTEWKYTPLAASTYNEAYITFTATGDTSLNGFSNVSGWGINRYSQNFTTNYTTALESNTYCGLWRPNAGVLVHHVNNGTYTLTLGVDTEGNSTKLKCAYGFKVSWTDTKGSDGTLIFSY